MSKTTQFIYLQKRNVIHMFLHENSFQQINVSHNPEDTPFNMFAITPFEIRHTSSSLGNVIQETDYNSTTQWTREEHSPFTSSIESFEKHSIENDCRVQSTNTKMRKNFFPEKLMKMLASPEYKDCIAWRDDGGAFYFVDREKLIQKISSANLRSTPYKNKSFTRKLNRWGFRKKGTHHGMYYHELFQRDKPWLCLTMVAEKSNDPKEAEFSSSSRDEADGEPLDRKRKSPNEDIIGYENEILDQSIKRRRLSDGFEMEYQNEALLPLNVRLNNLFETERMLALTEHLIREKIRSMRSDPLLYKRCCEIQKLFGFQIDDMSRDT